MPVKRRIKIYKEGDCVADKWSHRCHGCVRFVKFRWAIKTEAGTQYVCARCYSAMTGQSEPTNGFQTKQA